MSLGPFLIVAAAVHGLLGLAALIAPDATAATFGIAVDAGTGAIVRLLGSTLLGVAAILWWARSLEPAKLIQGVLIGGLVVNLLSLIVTFSAVTGGVMGPRGWIGAAVRLLLAAGFAYFAVVKREGASPRRA